MRPRVFITGSFVVGLTMRVPRVPVPGETLIGDSFHMGPGGKGSNQAVGAARLGAVVNLLACVGDDRFADMATDLYAREGLAMRHIHRVAGSYTAMGFVSLLPSGENWITLDMGANLHTSPAHVEAASAQIAVSDVVMTQFEVPPDAVARTLQLGRAHGALTILNPAPARPLSAGALADVDLLTPNETETRILLGLAPDDPAPVAALAQELLGLGVGRVVVTLGERGALIVSADGVEPVPTVALRPLDSTGAGDSFNAALATGLGEGLTLRAAVERACHAGAFTTQRAGVIDGLPTRAELTDFISARQATADNR